MKHTKKSARHRHRRRRNRKLLAVVLLALVLALAIAAVVFLGTLLFSSTESDEPSSSGGTPSSTASTTTTTTLPPTTTTTYMDIGTLELQAQSAILYDATSNTVLYAYQPNQQMPPASITKMLIAATALRLCDASTWMKVGTEVDRRDPTASLAYLQKGDQYKLKDLVAALLLPSGSDAAYCIAVNVGREKLGQDTSEDAAIEYFMQQVNQLAKEVGANSTHFVTPDGMHDDAHLTTAEDLLCIVRYCMQQPIIVEITGKVKHTTGEVKTPSGSNYGIPFHNTNALLKSDSEFYYEYAVGGKTGYTDEAGYCMAAVAEKNGRQLIAVVLGEPTSEQRFADCRALFELVFAG